MARDRIGTSCLYSAGSGVGLQGRAGVCSYCTQDSPELGWRMEERQMQSGPSAEANCIN